MSKRAEIEKYRQAASDAVKIGELIKKAQTKMRQTGRDRARVGLITVQIVRLPGFPRRRGPKPRILYALHRPDNACASILKGREPGFAASLFLFFLFYFNPNLVNKFL